MAIDLEISVESVGTVYPLASMQQNMWSYAQFLKQPGLDVEQLVGDLREELDARAFENAWRQAFARHAVLRTGFRNGDTPQQEVYEKLEFIFALEDWTNLRRGEQKKRFAAWLKSDRARGFDPEVPPLMRIALIRLSKSHYRFIWTFHHLLLDATAFTIVLKEVFASYEALHEGYELELGGAVSFCDYIRWFQELDFETDHSFWAEYLRGFETPTPLVVARTTARDLGEKEATHGQQDIKLSEAETLSLKSSAEDLGVKLSTVVEAAWGLLLARYSGEKDVVFGGVRACRSSSFPRAKSVVGLLINTIPVRLRIDPEVVVGKWLQEFRRDQLKLHAHEHTPLSGILNSWETGQGGSLFETILNYQNITWQDELGAQGEEWGNRTFAIHNQPNYPLWADCHGGQQMVLSIGYDRSRFEDDTIDRMLKHFKTLVCGMAGNPNGLVRELTILSRAERESLLTEWNQTDVDFPQQKCVHELFEAQAVRTPNHPAVSCGDRELSYAELNRRANELAHRLRENGVGPESIVGVCLERSIELVVGLLGILKAGGAYLPVDPKCPKERIRFMLTDSRAGLLLTHPTQVDCDLAAEIRCVFIEAKESARGCDSSTLENLERFAKPNDLAYVIYTSGSTGTPKGVAVEHRSLMNLVAWHQRAYEIVAEDRATQVASPAFDAAVWEIWPYLASGASIHIPDEETKMCPEKLLGWMLAREITLSFLPTPLAEALMVEPWPAGMRLRALLTGGEKLQRPAPKGFGCWLTNHYGPTESTVVTSAAIIEPDADQKTPPPIGYPIANTRIYLLDGDGEPVPIGVPGELHISGIGLARGYLNQPELTAQRFVCNPFAENDPAYNRLYKTGDVARYLPDGNIEFLGRKDDQIKMRGYRIEPGEIESVLAQHPGIQKAIVMSRTSAGADKLIAYVVPKPRRKPSIKQFREFLAGQLPEYMIPSDFAILDSIPLTVNGKVDRKALASCEPEMETTFALPRTSTEVEVIRIWGEILGGNPIGREDDFFELGGHSLQATRVMSRLQAAFQVELPLQLLFQGRTVAGLAGLIDAKRSLSGAGQINAADSQSGMESFSPSPENNGSGLRKNGDNTLPLSFAQERIWFFEQLEPGIPLYNVPIAIELRGELDLGALERSIKEIVRRHSALRTSFFSVNGRPIARENSAWEIGLPIEDLTNLPVGSRRAEVQRLAEEEAKRPFDLSASPLLRARVLTLGRDDNWLLVTTHHIVSDGWSMGVFYRELGDLYSAFSQGKPSPLSELTIQYKEYAQWQRNRVQGDLWEREIGYWKEQLNGAPSVLELPTDRPRGVAQTYRGAIRSFEVSGETSEALTTLASDNDLTLFMILAGGFQALLHRYTGQDDIVIGTPIAGRTRPDTEGLIGLFLNTQALRIDFSGDPNVSELLKRVRTMALGAYSHQELPFEKLVEAVHPQRDLSRSPIFQVMFVLQNEPLNPLVMRGLTARLIPIHSGTSKYDLTISLEEKATGLSGYVEFNTDLFDEATIDRLIGHYQTLLSTLGANPKEKVSRLTVLSEQERRELQTERTKTQTPFETEKCIHEFFEEQVARTPKAIAVQFEDEQATYEELNEWANELAADLRELGVGPEVGVAICVKRSIQMLVGLLGILKAGGYYVPLDPGYPHERLIFMLEDSGAAVLVTETDFDADFYRQEDPGFSEPLRQTDADLPRQRLRLTQLASMDGPAAVDRFAESRTLNSSHLAYVIYTSGSTGRPKGVMVTHKNVANFFGGIDQLLGVTPGVWLAVTSISFDISVLELFWTLARGFKVVIHSEQSGSTELLDNVEAKGHRRSVPEQIIRHKISHLQCTPSLAGTLVLAPESVQAMRSLSKLLLGGEALPFSLAQKLRPLVAGEIWNMYGPTETTVWSSAARLGKADEPITIGKPIANTQIYILDRHLQPVGTGIPGEIYIGGEGVARGYFHQPELTAERFVSDPFSNEKESRLYRTGDLGRYKANGEIEFLGRVDQQVKLRGHRIELGEIEALICSHPSVKETAVRVWENGSDDKRLAAYVVCEAGMRVDHEQLRQFAQQHLPSPMVPSVFVQLDRLPLTPNGKVDRKALPQPEVDRSISTAQYVVPGNEIERKIAEVWQELLGLETVGARDNFFDLGGHSLIAVQVQAQLRLALGVDLPVVKLFQYPTVESLAAFLNRQEEEPRSAHQRGHLKQAAYARRGRRAQEVLQ